MITGSGAYGSWATRCLRWARGLSAALAGPVFGLGALLSPLALSACLALLPPLALLALTAPAAAQTSHILIDAPSGTVLEKSRADRVRPPASLTKMMTLYMTFEALEDGRLRPNQRLRASQHVANQPASEVGLRRGDHLSVREAVRASAVFSANDAAALLAEAIAGTESAFAERMTAKARSFGMANTTFRNASGLPAAGHVSTARDMAILARRLRLDFPDYFHLFSRRKVTVNGRTRGATNSLLTKPGVDGLKTGYTRAAGFSLAASAVRGEASVMAIYLGGESARHRHRAVSALIDRAFLLRRRGVSVGQLEGEAPLRAAHPPRPRPAPKSEEIMVASTPQQTPASVRTLDGVVVRDSVLKGWAVQVGAFRDLRAANRRMDAVVALDAPGLTLGFRKLVTAPHHGASSAAPSSIHRVRFTGLAETDARTACNHLSGAGFDCALVPPVGWAR